MREKKRPKLAPNVQWKNGAYHYVKRQPGEKHATWTRLGVEPREVYDALKELHAPTVGMMTVFTRYEREIMPKKSAETQKTQGPQLINLKQTFGGMDPPTIRPMHVAQFHDAYGVEAPVAANRHLALFSSVCAFAMRIGAMDTNPCRGIARHTERPRDRYVTDEEFRLIYPFAGETLQILMDLARLVGQREGNLLRLPVPPEKAPTLKFPAQKGGKAIEVECSADLQAVIDRARAMRKRLQKEEKVVCMNLVVNEDGQPLTRSGLQSAVRRMWGRYKKHLKEAKPEVVVPHFTFHDLRAKAGSDSGNEKMLGHKSVATFRKVYDRKPTVVKPVS